MSAAIHPVLPISPRCQLVDLPRQTQYLLLTLRLAHELSIEDRNFQGFVYTLCGVSRVERALLAVGDVLQCLGRAPRKLVIASAVRDDLAEDERRLLELLRCRWDFGLALAGRMVPSPADEMLVQSLNRLADTLE